MTTKSTSIHGATAISRDATLLADLDVSVEPLANLGQRTWFRTGGRADLLVTPHSVDALARLVNRTWNDDVPLRVFGGGANLLVLDEGVDGLVVSLDSPAFRTLEVERGGGSTSIRTGAGHDLFKLMHELNRAGLSGLEHLAGIPGTVGGAVVMNAGGTNGDTAQALSTVDVLGARGDVAVLDRASLDCGYRHGGIPAGIVTRATFRVEPTDPSSLRSRFQELFAWKKSHQPFAASSAGCMFKNPIDPETQQRVSAGMLVDRAGLKELRSGGAFVSPVHANFMALDPGGSATDIAALAVVVAARVFDHCGIRLEREVVFWGRNPHG